MYEVILLRHGEPESVAQGIEKRLSFSEGSYLVVSHGNIID